jgi:hypothetical protein
MKNRHIILRINKKKKPLSLLMGIFLMVFFIIGCSDNITPQQTTNTPEEQKGIDLMKKEDFISLKPLLLNKESELITSLKLDTINIQLPNLSEKIKKNCQGYKLTVFYEDTLKGAFDSETRINESNVLPFEVRLTKSGKYFLRLTCSFYNSKIELEQYTLTDIPVFVNRNLKEESIIHTYWDKTQSDLESIRGIGFDEKKQYKLIFSNDYISKSFEKILMYKNENELRLTSVMDIEPNAYTISLVESNNLIGFQEAVVGENYQQFGVGFFSWWDSETQKMTTSQLSKVRLGRGEYIITSNYGVDQEYLRFKNIVNNKEYVINTEKIVSPTPSLNNYKYIFPDTFEEGKYELVKEKIVNSTVGWKKSFRYSRIIEFVK